MPSTSTHRRRGSSHEESVVISIGKIYGGDKRIGGCEVGKIRRK
jgi:hypothetical protein